MREKVFFRIKSLDIAAVVDTAFKRKLRRTKYLIISTLDVCN